MNAPIDRAAVVGWMAGFFLIVGPWSISNVAFSYAAVVLKVGSVYFAASSFIGAAAALALLAGRGPLVVETLRAPATWVYGAANLVNYVVTINILNHVTASSASMMQRLSIVFGLAMSWYVSARRPGGAQLLGASVVTVGVALVIAELGADILFKIGPWLLLSAGLQAARIVAAERHKPYAVAENSQAGIADQLRVVSVVMGVLGITFITASALIGVARTETGLWPSADRAFDSSAIISIATGLALGVVFVAPNRFFEFFVTARIGANGFLALASLTPLLTLGWEFVLAPITDAHAARNIDPTFVVALILSAVGGLIAADLRSVKSLRL